MELMNKDAMKHEEEAFCAYFQKAVELIGSRWTGAIIRALLSGVHRFSGLTETVPGLSDRMLAERLRELEAEGIIERVVFPEMPVRIEYHLTEKGRALSGVIEAIVSWLEHWTEEPAAPFSRHEVR
jgi:DNA-binding HxlR family transcriptional regulator